MPKLFGDASEYSFSLLRFDPASLPAGKPTKATLVLTLVAGPNFTEEQAKKFPLQARPVEGGFTEKGWKYDLLERFMPAFEPKSVYGTGVPSPWPAPEKEARDRDRPPEGPRRLPRGVGGGAEGRKAARDRAHLGARRADQPREQTLYKVYSKDAPVEELRPRLVFGFESSGKEKGKRQNGMALFFPFSPLAHNRNMANPNYQSASEMVRSLDKIRVPFEELDVVGPFRLLQVLVALLGRLRVLAREREGVHVGAGRVGGGAPDVSGVGRGERVYEGLGKEEEGRMGGWATLPLLPLPPSRFPNPSSPSLQHDRRHQSHRPRDDELLRKRVGARGGHRGNAPSFL